MPKGIEDHETWEKAKKKAEEEGKGGNYKYIMSIYKEMKGDGDDNEDGNKKEGAYNIINDVKSDSKESAFSQEMEKAESIGDAVENIYREVGSEKDVSHKTASLDKNQKSDTLYSGRANQLRKIAGLVEEYGIEEDGSVNADQLANFVEELS